MYKSIAKVDKILDLDCFANSLRPVLKRIIDDVLASQREDIKNGKSIKDFDETVSEIYKKYKKFQKHRPQKIVNATGTILHTNFGRSVIDEQILDRSKDIICSHINLEFDLADGKRGGRAEYLCYLLSSFFGCEDALVVNNNASAVFLVLNSLCKDMECVVSRGELVEIGGGFRVNEVMNLSGAKLKEVGATNRCNLQDYENAISEKTKILFKAHRSNFDMVGFTKNVDVFSICEIAKRFNLISYYDLGSGYESKLGFGLDKKEPCISKLIKSGVNLLSFSSDKLFGSVQGGIILGKKDLIDKIKTNQLYRMMRVDKISISLLCESVKAYMNNELELITPLKLINNDICILENIANSINASLKKPLKIIKTYSFVGGGSMPNKKIPSIAFAIEDNPQKYEKKFRDKNVIGRICEDKFLLDLRTVLEKDIDLLKNIIKEICDE